MNVFHAWKMLQVASVKERKQDEFLECQALHVEITNPVGWYVLSWSNSSVVESTCANHPIPQYAVLNHRFYCGVFIHRGKHGKTWAYWRPYHAIPTLFSDVFCDFNPGHQFLSTLRVRVGKFSLHAEVMLLGRPSFRGPQLLGSSGAMEQLNRGHVTEFGREVELLGSLTRKHPDSPTPLLCCTLGDIKRWTLHSIGKIN